jgi:hypothetical protein
MYMSRIQRPATPHIRAIGERLIGMLMRDFGLTMTEAAAELGYANATTLHKVRRGMALPDPARLAAFAERQTILRHRTMNLHWIWTGKGARLIAKDLERARNQPSREINDVDIINIVTRLEPEARQALLTLIGSRK